MASEALPVERLRDYLRELKPEARALLMSELERARLRGDEMPAAAMVLQELRKAAPEPGPSEPAPASAEPAPATAPAAAAAAAAAAAKAAPTPGPKPAAASGLPPRIGHPARLFFTPLEPFLVDDRPDRKHNGRIARSSLDPIWDYVSRDLMPAEVKAYSEQVSQLLLAGDSKKAEQLARTLQDRAVVRLQETLATSQADDKARRRLAVRIGTPQALDEIADVYGVLKVRDALAVIGSRLPSLIRNLADEQLDNVKALLDSPIARHRETFLYALVLVMSRLGMPWQLIRLAVRAADSDVAARIADTPFAVAVTVVLADVERILGRLRDALKGGSAPAIGALLKDIHDAARALRTEMDLSGDSPWARQLAGIRTGVSALLKAEIDSTPGRVRRLLRPRPAKEIAPDSSLDAGDVAETETAVELVSICRNYASELAVNELTSRVYSELQNYLDTGTSPLLDGLRSCGPADRKFRLSQVDAAVRFSAKIFGVNYAALLAKAAEVAAQGEARAAKA
jgi:hypothetical protein